jgi:cytochrome c oxidase subunit IV
MATTETTGPGMRLYVLIWLALLATVAVEVLLAYAHLPSGTLVAALLALAVVEAGLGVMYFMHLRYERRILVWCLIPTLVFVFVMMNHIWRDAARMITLHP